MRGLGFHTPDEPTPHTPPTPNNIEDIPGPHTPPFILVEGGGYRAELVPSRKGRGALVVYWEHRRRRCRRSAMMLVSLQGEW